MSPPVLTAGTPLQVLQLPLLKCLANLSSYTLHSNSSLHHLSSRFLNSHPAQCPLPFQCHLRLGFHRGTSEDLRNQSSAESLARALPSPCLSVVSAVQYGSRWPVGLLNTWNRAGQNWDMLHVENATRFLMFCMKMQNVSLIIFYLLDYMLKL